MDVVINCDEQPDTRVHLHDFNRTDDWDAAFSVGLHAPGVSASLTRVLLCDYDLAGFLGQIAERYAGWDGELEWRSIDDDLAVTARFHTGGHVELTWALTQRRLTVARWRAEITVWLEAGEEMRLLAADVRELCLGT